MSGMTLLQLAQEFCKRKGLPQPTTVSGAQDATTQQIWGLLNEGIQEINDRYNHFQTQIPYTFNHMNLANYGALVFDQTTNLNWKFFVDDTLWDTTNRRKVAGPYSLAEWQQLTTFGISQAVYNFTFDSNRLAIYPVPSPLDSVLFSFFYQQSTSVFCPSTGEFNEYYTTDDDFSVMPSYVLLADIKWRYAKEKGLPYAEDLRMAEEMLANMVGRVPQGILTLDKPDFDAIAMPTLYVAAGNTIPP